MFVVKVPGINGLGKTNGCEKAGNEILKALKDVHSNESRIPVDVQVLDLEEIHLDNSDLELSGNLICKNSLKAFETKPKTIFLGGDHSISYWITKSFREFFVKRGKETCLIVFDAHADCMPPMKEPSHEEWLRKLIECGFPAENILLVGTRNMWKEEIQFTSEKKIKIMEMKQLLENLEESCDVITEFPEGKELYVSIDIDFLDPAFAPGTGYKEPGGLSAREFIYVLQRIKKIKNLRGIDVTEINPEKDVEKMTTKLGAKILSELL